MKEGEKVFGGKEKPNVKSLVAQYCARSFADENSFAVCEENVRKGQKQR